ncbi:carboxypeptidase M32 [Weissella viridescens]|uniref:carboxypeptidase M32 n=1 Tax=Weissella viridescens TaxID=1629 RepID=UPI001D085EEF|nr:carboxypeptidase M32 [Weissella viridescens]MCB6840920.1 carboxypeptidase M32 [Weissella viridescens]MCB6847653.1 carboxypeptidase M32 [Weissella viridescens]
MTEFTGADLRANMKEKALIEESLALAEWDQLTGMPVAAGDFRAELVSYLSSKYFQVATGAEAAELVAYFKQHRDLLTDDEQKLFDRYVTDYEEVAAIPEDEYTAFGKLSSAGQDAWTKAREADDYQLFAPALKELIATKKRFISYWRKDEATPYDVLLNQFEPGLTVAKLDDVFETLKNGIMDLQHDIQTQGTEPESDFLSREIPVELQRAYVWDAAQRLGYDAKKGRLDDTIHPFMQDLNRDDARITTRWSATDFQMAVLGIYHEAGHGLFAQNVAAKWDYTPFNKGIAMSIHESQSLFNEVMIGRSKDFWSHEYPILQQAVDGRLDDVDFARFFKGWMITKPTLIRTEADPITYPLHIIIRYEIEKAIFNDDYNVDDLESLWNSKYEEYLGIRPETAVNGILQDIHWASGDFGYFPSYALGHLYAAQFYHAMHNDFDVEALLAEGDIKPIFEWRREHVWQYGASKTPAEVLEAATGETLNPQYWLDLQRARYADVYDFEA